MLSWEGVTLNEESKVWALSFQAELPPSADWASAGWSMAVDEDVRYPIFTRAIKKKERDVLAVRHRLDTRGRQKAVESASVAIPALPVQEALLFAARSNSSRSPGP